MRNNGTASLLPSAVASAIYDAANEQTTFAGATLQYDANGNLTNDGVNTYQWDARNRLVSISGGTTASFSYDALGRRTNKTVNSVPSQSLYDGNDIAAEIGGGAVGANYLRSLSIDEPFIRQSGTGNEFYHIDALGSSLVLSNTAGASTTTYTYEPFGKTTLTGLSANALQFTGRENDGGFYYYRARYYSPSHGRFIAQDPWEFAAGDMSLYSYAGNSPINYYDPFGLAPSISQIKQALRQVYEILGGPLPKGEPGKFGSPQRGDTIKGYRLDPPHPSAKTGTPDSYPHVNYWDYTKGKRSSGQGIKGSVPIGAAASAVAIIGNFIDPFSAISGELAGPEDDMIPIGPNDLPPNLGRRK